MILNRLTIKFPSRESRSSFIRSYRGNSWSYHPNYDGSFREDETLGGHTPYLYMERDHVKDFARLYQDIAFFHGQVMIDD